MTAREKHFALNSQRKDQILASSEDCQPPCDFQPALSDVCKLSPLDVPAVLLELPRVCGTSNLSLGRHTRLRLTGSGL